MLPLRNVVEFNDIYIINCFDFIIPVSFAAQFSHHPFHTWHLRNIMLIWNANWTTATIVDAEKRQGVLVNIKDASNTETNT